MSSIHYNRELNLARLRNWDLIVETHKKNVQYKIDRKLTSINNTEWNNKRDVEFVIRHDFYPELFVNEDMNFVPRFSIKKFQHPLFAEFPPNKEMKYSRDLMIKAIQFGMILMVQYRGEKDGFVQGHQRVIYPMCLGTSAKGKPLLRGYHLRGWSVSQNGNIQKDWRMFRTDRILSMSFTGSFFRLAPEGYNMNDKGMRGGIIKSANFDEIRKNQKSLIQKDVIQNKKEVVLDKSKITVIQVDSTDTKLDLDTPFSNPNIKEEDKKLIRMTFLKNVHTNQYVCVIGALGQKGNLVKMTSRGKYLGTFRVLKSTMGDHLNKPHLKRVEGKDEFDLYIFIKKISGGATPTSGTVQQPQQTSQQQQSQDQNKPEQVEPAKTEEPKKKEEKPTGKPPKFLDLMNKVAKIDRQNPNNK